MKISKQKENEEYRLELRELSKQLYIYNTSKNDYNGDFKNPVREAIKQAQLFLENYEDILNGN